MGAHDQFSALQVIAVRYRGVTPATADERALDAYAAANVYASAGLPVDICEPHFPTQLASGVKADDYGLFNGIIADRVAEARRANKAVLMTGGDCSHLTGVVGGLQQAHGAQARIGLVFFDAHGDYNTAHTTISGSLGGMPVAVCAGLTYPRWREGAKIIAPIPPDRIVEVGLRNLDPAEKQLLEATGVTMAAIAPGFPGVPLEQAINELASRCDIIYLHIDADILDEAYVPDHGTKEPNGPNMEQVQQAISVVMRTGKVRAYAIVSIYAGGPNRERNIRSGIELIEGGLTGWREMEKS
jgi:arginase